MLRSNHEVGFLMQRNLQDNMARYYDQEFEPSTITRDGRHGMPYAIQNEQRYVPSNADRPRNGSRGNQYTPEQEDDANKQGQRRRIPIAVS